MCEQKGIEIIEAEACPDHIHMLISFSPKYSISYVMGYLKGKNKKKIQGYIKNQLQQDQIADQLSLKEFVDP